MRSLYFAASTREKATKKTFNYGGFRVNLPAIRHQFMENWDAWEESNEPTKILIFCDHFKFYFGAIIRPKHR